MQSVTIPMSLYKHADYGIKVGDKIKASKRTKIFLNRKIKGRNMVGRLLKKPFQPIFIVTSTNSTIEGQFNFNMKPYNF